MSWRWLSIARHIVSLKVFFRYLQLEGALTDNLAELLGSQKLWERVPKVLSVAQVDRLLAAPGRTDPWYRRDRALLELLYATGCRASELSRLKLCDVHLDDCYCLCHGKGDKERLTPLNARAVAVFREYLAHERPQLAAGKRGQAPLCEAPGGPFRQKVPDPFSAPLGAYCPIAGGGCGGNGFGNC